MRQRRQLDAALVQRHLNAMQLYLRGRGLGLGRGRNYMQLHATAGHNYMQPAWNLTQVTAGRMQLHCSCVTWIRMRLSWSGAGSGAAAQQH